ncbi:YdiK family protein [Alteribacter aurantiacus]|uniref:YdiK family protein n=1 Tax=Alteribacter aurantiacus TaxID=254410 RepID=UPI0003FCA0BF|nr:YdiK family protein [Alteribacter aurantiacus]
MRKSPMFWAFLYFSIATMFVFLATQQNTRTDGWDFLTIILMVVATIDYVIAFRFYGMARRARNNDKK